MLLEDAELLLDELELTTELDETAGSEDVITGSLEPPPPPQA